MIDYFEIINWVYTYTHTHTHTCECNLSHLYMIGVSYLPAEALAIMKTSMLSN